ncbi:MAG: 4Fe-4S binding protein [Clostridia bacterium]|nr:4Fe-4S binding protein [Clostridia bacterium]
MKRTVIEIDRDACIGCGQCASACHQGAIAMVDGKAKLVKEDHCDGLGMCLPHCPVDAIQLVEKEIEAAEKPAPQAAFVCPSTIAKQIEREEPTEYEGAVSSHLNQWPCQIKLINPTAPYFDNADLLIAADCCAFAFGDFHRQFMKDKITVMGCPKLDDIDYSDKLSDIISYNNIKSITVTRMSVPCCRGLTHAVEKAIQKSGKNIPLNVHVLSTDGEIIR